MSVHDVCLKMTSRFHRIVIVSLCLLCVVCKSENIYSRIEYDLSPEDGRLDNSVPFLNHLIIRDDTLYIGAVNKIFKLQYNGYRLVKLANVTTGPLEDNPDCSLPISRCTRTLRPRNNVNKVLLLYSDRNRIFLISCGTVFQGVCETRNHENLELQTRYDNSDVGGVYSLQEVYAIAADTPTASTVAYIAPGPMDTDLMYVASTFTGNEKEIDVLRNSVPAISTRKLGVARDMFKYYYYDDSFETQSSSVHVKARIREYFIVDYITGFTSGNFSYFLVTQPKSEKSNELKRITKIIHLCQSDEKLYSYVDLPLVCRDSNTTYDLVTAGKVIQPGSLLQTNMSIYSPGGEVLVAAFRQSTGNKSAVCVFSMSEVQKRVKDNARLCRNGDTTVNGDKYIEEGSQCAERSVELERNLWCNEQSKIFARIAGILGVEMRPAITFENINITSIALATVIDSTVAFLGTSKGTIKKIVLDSATSAMEYDTGLQEHLTIDLGSPVNQDMFLDGPKDHLYAMSRTKVVRMRVENCERYKTCSACLMSMDPYCGWCTLEKRFNAVFSRIFF